MSLLDGNIAGYLRLHYGRETLAIYDRLKIAHERHQSILMDIRFLKACRSNDVIPKFLWFKTANKELFMSSAYRQCQRLLLNAEINLKYRAVSGSRKNYLFFLDQLKQMIDDNVLQEVLSYIDNRSHVVLSRKEKNLKDKMSKYEFRYERVPVVNRKVVKNFSSRVLSNEETYCLANGFDYGLVPKKVDDINIISNVESFFHRITNISEHHKKIIAELNDKDEAVDSDLRVLTSKEMTLASKLRSLTDLFRVQAHRFGQVQSRINTQEQRFRHLLKNLKEDTSIVVTRPDKGRGVVLLNKVDYLSKMHTVVNDSTKFTCLLEDPTIKREAKLVRLLNKLSNEGHITTEFHMLAKPTGSIPGRLYGLPKIHKKNIPLRPVLSAIGTFNYGLGKALAQILSSIIEKKNMIRDSLSFVKELLSLPISMSQYKMVSFDIASLYTNVPLDETIDIILKRLYDGPLTPPAMNQSDMKELLHLATSSSHFLFDGKLYDQIDGVSMGSPLAPLLAEIFLQEFERKYLSTFNSIGIIYWKRYVDDTFVLLDSMLSIKDICSTLSQYHPSLEFTSEEEHLTEHKLPFLDVLVKRRPNCGFETSVYRKPTFTCLITKWDSFVPKIYKYNALSTMVYRAIKICSSDISLRNEFQFIRKLAIKNGYPNSIVNSTIRRQLNLIDNPAPVPPPSLNTDIIVFRIPYFGPLSQVYAKRITSTANKNYPLKKIRIIYDVKDRIGTGFTLKDPIPNQMQSGVVYETTCPECKVKYIGKTYRHLKTRIHEHLNDQKNDLCLTKTKKQNKTSKIIKSSFKPNMERKGCITRSQTGKLPKPIVRMNPEDLDELLKHSQIIEKKPNPNTVKSSIAKHYFTTGHIFHNDDFRIRLKEKHKYKLTIKESLLIRTTEPQLNKGVRSIPLYIYPDGLDNYHEKQPKNEQNSMIGSFN